MSDITWSMTTISTEASVEVYPVDDRIQAAFDSPCSTVTLSMPREVALKLLTRLEFALESWPGDRPRG